MIQLGKLQTLKVLRNTSVGVYLGDENEESDLFQRTSIINTASLPVHEILLPKNQISETLSPGDEVEVFIYKDSEDRPIATRISPLIQLDQIATLEVKAVTEIGAFLDWGLSKDLLLPFREQTFKVTEIGEKVTVALYVDKSSRLCATMKLYPYLLKDSPYLKEDRVQGLLYEYTASFGAFVAVNGKYSALIPKKELHSEITVGSTITARVTKVHEDGKLELSLREKPHIQIDQDSTQILAALKDAGGFLPYHDKTNPELIKTKFHLSKNAFKRSIGHLMKIGKIEIMETGIRLK